MTKLGIKLDKGGAPSEVRRLNSGPSLQKNRAPAEPGQRPRIALVNTEDVESQPLEQKGFDSSVWDRLIDRHFDGSPDGMLVPKPISVESITKANDVAKWYPSDSKAMQAVLLKIQRATENDRRVLVLGETGTGKDHLARVIHDHSSRSKGAYRVVNCATIPAQLLESELYGHVMGAFTGSAEEKPGEFELTHDGTIFLTEIGDLPLDQQAKLFMFLDYGHFTRVGGTKKISSNARVITATNKDLEEEIKAGHFRLDLLQRLKKLVISLPPLRERPEDIPYLTRVCLLGLGEEFNVRPKITLKALYSLIQHHWVGNVRELQSKLEDAVDNTKDAGIQVSDIDFGKVSKATVKLPRPSKTLSAADLDYIIKIRRVREPDGDSIAEIAKERDMDRAHLSRQIKAREDALLKAALNGGDA